MPAYRKRSPLYPFVAFSILAALIVVLQLFGSFIKIGTVPIALTLIPIVLGAILLGPCYGAGLGFVFGAIVFIMGVTGMDPFTFILFTDHPILTALICFVKGTAAGLGAGLVYRVFSKKAPIASVFAASAVTPIINTGLFILGALLLRDTLSSKFLAEGQTVIYFLVIVCAGINFLVEFAINLFLAPALVRIVSVIRTQLSAPKRSGY